MKILLSVIGILGLVVAVTFFTQPESLDEQVRQQAALANQADTAARLEPNTPSQGPLLNPVNLEVPNFTAQTTDGEEITLSELVQDKPTIVGFWASWCHNCQRNLPIQDEIFQKYKDQVNIVEVNLSEDRAAVDRYASQNDFSFPLVYDEQGVIGNSWQIRFTNTHFLIGSDGKLIEGFPGDIAEEHFEALLAG